VGSLTKALLVVWVNFRKRSRKQSKRVAADLADVVSRLIDENPQTRLTVEDTLSKVKKIGAI